MASLLLLSVGLATSFSHGQSLPQTITITAVDPDGTNTGTARLGVALSLTATVSPGPHPGVSWILDGPGAFHSGGENESTAVYNPPESMPASATVAITAYLTGNPAVRTSYTFKLINPLPVVTRTTPAQLLSGGTQTVDLVGSGFVSVTTILLNGKHLPVALTDYLHATVQVPVPANASGSISLQAQNPGPGGGTGTAFTETIPTKYIALTATGPDGVNTGEARLGASVVITAQVGGSMQKTVSWSASGGGSISSDGVYTAPLGLSGPVVISATLVSDPNIKASYRLNLIDPVPVISGATPVSVPAGTTTSVTLTGSGFVPGTIFSANAGTVTATYQSATSVIAKINLPANATGNLSLHAQNAAPGGGTSAAIQLPIFSIQIIATDPDGTNPGTARLGVPIKFATTVANAPKQERTWSQQGAGSFHSGGPSNDTALYTPPQTMPADPTVSFTASMTSFPSVTASYSIKLINPIPSLSENGETPSQLLSGGTQQIALGGSGFVPGMVVLLAGQALSTDFIDYGHATVQIPVPGNAAGTLSLQLQNPAPGGGPGSIFTVAVAPNSIALTATDQDGINTGTAELGTSVSMAATVTGSEQTAVIWSCTGAGSISSSGVYTAPAVLPANNAVTIYAALASNPSITASYALHVINPVPAISDASPLQVPAGATTAVTLTGSGFVPQTVILVNNSAVPTTYQSSTSVVAQVTVPANATGNVSIQGQNPAPVGGTSAEFEEAITTPISVTAAARVLDQTTFGPTTSLIQHVQQEGITAWLNEQFHTPSTVLAAVPTPQPSYCGEVAACVTSEWWQAVLNGNDQLRQRVAFALSELFVISTDTVTGEGVTPYVNMLANDAFSNWYTIMNDVTLSPAMGIYLNLLDSKAAMGSLIANENYARENLQLFNLGLSLLNQDGTLQLDANGNPQPTYNEAQVQAFARAYTGWTYANPDGSVPTIAQVGSTHNYTHALVPIEAWHDQTAKTLLNGTSLPAGQTAEQDLAGALTNIFQHPNTPPFVCKQLIQHLVTSNPSPGYLSRVAAVFIDNGSHVRGDMQAVLTAIFTDPEARAGDTEPTANGGHLREPILWLTAVMRGLGYVNINPNNYYESLSDYSARLGESPYGSPSVFNFFPAEYQIPGTALNGPEFGIENTASVMDRLALADELVNNGIASFNVDLSATSPLGQMASNPAGLVDALGSLFTHAQMDPNTRAAILSEVSSISDLSERVRIAVYLIITSSQYKISH